MRSWIDIVQTHLNEAALDFSAVTSKTKAQAGKPVFDFVVPFADGNATIYATVTIDNNYANLDLVTVPSEDGHPEMFYTNKHPDAPGEYGIGVKLGTSEMRRLLRHIMQAVQAEYPEVDRLAGWRATGARGFHGAPNPNMSLKMPKS